MLKRRTESARILMVTLDALLLAASFVLAFLLKVHLVLADPELQPVVYARLYLITAPFLALALSACGFYRLAPGAGLPDRRPARQHAVWGGFVCMTVLILVGFTVQPLDPAGNLAAPYSRAIAFMFGAFAVLALSLSRTLVAALARRRRGAGWTARVLVFGMSPRVLKLLGLIERTPQVDVEVVGVDAADVPAGVAPRLPPAEALALLEQGQVDQVLVEQEGLPAGRLDEILRLADREGVSVHITSPIFPATRLVPTWERLDGVPVLGFVNAELPFGARVVKRAFDIGLSSLALLLLAPFLLGLALAIRLESRGPALFVQQRVGARGRPFRMLKFRTMRTDAEVDGPVFAVENDPRCTRLGGLLRRWNLDELPQLLNVLLGHMSLVGPRPERPEFVGDFKRTIPRYAHKHWVRPGITGWAQVHGLRGAATSLEDRIDHDLYYIENWSLLLDIRILMRTVVDGYLNAI